MYTTDRTLKAVSFSPWKYCNLHSITFFIAFIQSLFNIINYSVLTFLTFWSPQIDDLETLEAAREDDLHRAGLKMGDIIKIRRVLQARSKESPLNSSLSSLSGTGSVDITLDSKKSPTQSVSVLSITIYIFPPKRHVSFLCCCEAPSLILEYNFIDRE